MFIFSLLFSLSHIGATKKSENKKQKLLKMMDIFTLKQEIHIQYKQNKFLNIINVVLYKMYFI